MFPDIETLTADLDTSAFQYRYHHQIADEFRARRDAAAGDSVLAETCQWEMDVFNFEIAKNRLIPLWSATDAAGKAIQCPDLARWDSRAYDYIEQRLGSCTHALLRARYAHLMWLSPRRKHTQARTAVDSYLELLPVYQRMDHENSGALYGVDVLHAFENVFALGFQVGHRKDELVREARRLLFKYPRRSSSSFALRATVIETLLAGRSPMHRRALKGAQRVCWDVGGTKHRRKDFHQAIELFSLGEKIDKRFGEQTFDWQRGIAEAYERLALDGERRKNPAARDFCLKAMHHFRQCGDVQKADELKKRYGAIREDIALGRIETPIEMGEINAFAARVANDVVQAGTEGALQHLAVSTTLLPAASEMETRASEQAEQFISRKLFPIQILDANGHPSQHFQTDEEKLRYSVLWNYGLSLQLGCLQIIETIVVRCIEEEVLDADKVIDWLKGESWLGRELVASRPPGESVTYTWVSACEPAIRSYFGELKQAIGDPNHRLCLILQIDSLSLKLEGVLRDLTTFSGGSTFFTTHDEQGRTVVREKDVHALLHEQCLTDLLGPDDTLFLRYLLIEKSGLGLRHKIAHCLMHPQEYALGHMHLLFVALLRLSRYHLAAPGDLDGSDSK